MTSTHFAGTFENIFKHCSNREFHLEKVPTYPTKKHLHSGNWKWKKTKKWWLMTPIKMWEQLVQTKKKLFKNARDNYMTLKFISNFQKIKCKNWFNAFKENLPTSYLFTSVKEIVQKEKKNFYSANETVLLFRIFIFFGKFLKIQLLEDQ